MAAIRVGLCALMVSGERVLVIGGGVGGLAAALALRRRGMNAEVFERTGEVRHAGSAVTLHAEARRALAALGTAEALDGLGGMRNRAFVLRSPRGRVFFERPGDAVTMAHRDLVRLLADRLPGDAVHHDARFAGFHADGGGVTAFFAGDREERGAVLVGADGINSAVGRQALGASPPRYSGFAAWRAIVTFAHPGIPPGIAQFVLGCGQRFGMIPMSQGRVDWFAWRATPEAGELERPSRLARHFRDWFSPIADLVDATPEEDVIVGRLYDRPPTRRWGTGRVTLLGDAAHAALPSSGRGAGLAVDDALVLADELSQADLGSATEIERALRGYEALRLPPTSAVVRRAWRNTRTATWTNPLVCWARDARFLALGLTTRLRERGGA